MLVNIKSLAIVGLAVGLLGLGGCATPPTNTTKVVYHVNDSAEATNAMRNANNHLSADPHGKNYFRDT